jgi:uncharacterized membrane protein YphA (DoxX/SURF4 family)
MRSPFPSPRGYDKSGKDSPRLIKIKLDQKGKSWQTWVCLVLRLVFGMIFVMHGCQQVRPSFDGGKGLKESVTSLAFVTRHPAQQAAER